MDSIGAYGLKVDTVCVPSITDYVSVKLPASVKCTSASHDAVSSALCVGMYTHKW